MIRALAAAAFLVPQADPEDLARRFRDVHRFSTLFTAQNVRDLLSSDEGIRAAVDWCRKTAVTKVYVESFRDGYQAESAALRNARERLAAAGLEVSGCVTTTGVGKRSTGWKVVSCYTDRVTQEKIREIFEFAARHFDEIMIDDFWFTDCTCPECGAAREARTVAVGGRAHPVSGDGWADYRCELMVQVSRHCVIGSAKRANPKVRLILKYPQWYDQFHVRGYDVVRQTADFDRIWVGTETRDYADKRWGGTPPYEAFFIMRWLGGLGGAKCGGGWFDPYGTTERTYVEQARQTILGGARESLLFCYGSLLKDTGPRNVEALRANLADLFSAAREVGRRRPAGLAAYKPPNSDPGGEPRVFDFVGMMGIPLVPCHEFPTEAPAAFFPAHAIRDPGLPEKLSAFIQKGRPVLVTDGLAKLLEGRAPLDRPNVRILEVRRDPKSLLDRSPEELDFLRTPLLKPFGLRFRAPNRVGLYLFEDGSRVVENFNDEAAAVEVDGSPLTVPPRGWVCLWK